MPQANSRSITPKLPRALPAPSRKLVESAIEAHFAAVEALMAFLDVADGDPDLEPSLASQSGAWEGTNQETWAGGSRDDREEEHDGREFGYTETHGKCGACCNGGDDDEPSLAHTNDINQARALKNATGTVYGPGHNTWHGHSSDLEAEHDGREPSLGAVERNIASIYPHTFSQEGWGAGQHDDCEDDGDDREPDVDDEPNRCPARMD